MGAGEVSGEDVHDRLGQGHPQRTTHDYPTPETPPPESIRSSCHGWLAGIVMKNGGYGLTGDILLGLGGSIVGSWLFRALGIAPEAGRLATVVVAFVGAAGPDRGPAQDLASERLGT